MFRRITATAAALLALVLATPAWACGGFFCSTQPIDQSTERIFYVADAFRAGMTLEEVYEYSMIDPWFLAEIEAILLSESRLADVTLSELGRDDLWFLKRQGFSDVRLAKLLRTSETQVRTARQALGVKPSYKRVDTCAAEFPAATAYMYSTYEEACEARPTAN